MDGRMCDTVTVLGMVHSGIYHLQGTWEAYRRGMYTT